ncbi:hypothetical protein IscW_ISCW014019 [Ixodes scapularis]|uniref:Uncharacterized protein n=1 Tax=Ixodes scapularis TaxID=6945 RepID=B7QIM0_IXOSC|nr:hypothetical protein IscW_ISCW014019 [Ixodes scapularis]|eukprot:XP_002415027.1 hypothetical protein IscW_ISCW014019 [Ixodes scapularis]
MATAWFENHEKSKKHRENVQFLKEAMEEEEAQLSRREESNAEPAVDANVKKKNQKGAKK